MRQVENVKNRSAGASVSVRRHQRAANASRDLFRSVPERSWRAPARPKSARGGPGAPQERSGSASGALLAAPLASWWRPGASPNRPAAPRRLQDRFFNDFGSIFRRFLLDFWSPGALLGPRRLPAFDQQNDKKTHRFRVRLAFCCSSWPARPPRSSPQLASQRF